MMGIRTFFGKGSESIADFRRVLEAAGYREDKVRSEPLAPGEYVEQHFYDLDSDMSPVGDTTSVRIAVWLLPGTPESDHLWMPEATHRQESLDCRGVSDAGVAKLVGHDRLRGLNLSGSISVTDASATVLAGLAGLRFLNLSGTAFTDTGVAALAAHTALAQLNLAQCRAVTDASLPVLSGLPGLERVDLSGTGVTASGLMTLASGRWVRLLEIFFDEVTEPELALAGRALATDQTGTAPVTLSISERTDLARLLDLRCFPAPLRLQWSLFGCRPPLERIDQLLNVIERLAVVAEIDLPNYPWDDRLLEIACRHPELTVLKLSGGKVTDFGVSKLDGHIRLRELDLLSCPAVSDASVTLFAGLHGLRSLKLDGTSITNAGMAVLAAHPGFHGLQLSLHTRPSLQLRMSPPTAESYELKGADVGEAVDALTVARLVHPTIQITLAHSDISFEWLDKLSQLVKVARVTGLDLYGLDIGAAWLSRLAHIPGIAETLEVLELGMTDIADDAIDSILRFRMLRELSLYGTAISDDSVRRASELPNVVRLDTRMRGYR